MQLFILGDMLPEKHTELREKRLIIIIIIAC